MNKDIQDKDTYISSLLDQINEMQEVINNLEKYNGELRRDIWKEKFITKAQLEGEEYSLYEKELYQGIMGRIGNKIKEHHKCLGIINHAISKAGVKWRALEIVNAYERMKSLEIDILEVIENCGNK